MADLQCPAVIPGALGWYCTECGRANGTYAADDPAQAAMREDGEP